MIVNLGTPDSPSVPDVKRYLDEFLMDPYVLTMNSALRWLLVKGVILNTRPAKSAHAYQSIWTPAGSPLLVASKDLQKKLQDLLGPRVLVSLGMRYGNPSIASAMDLHVREGASELLVCPLYPQYSLAATETAVDRAKKVAAVSSIKTRFTEPFYKDPGFIRASSEVYLEWARDRPAFDHYLFSFHGVPESHVQATDPSRQHCLKSVDCCFKPCEENHLCYRHHCFETAFALSRSLNLDSARCTVSFQSRLGRTPWIRPYTDEVVPQLAAKGVKRLAVFTPSFVADCLETLEEIQIRAAEDFVKAGGESLEQVPCVNAHPSWAQALAEYIQSQLS
jgi:ferrochelatase